MTFLIVGVDRRSLTPWHRNVMARDADAATQLARARASADGVALVIAAVIGPGGAVAGTEVPGTLVPAEAA
jgi:hypothetical protein